MRWLSDKCYINRQAEPGQPVIIVGIAEDITDKKQMETELHRLATTDALTQSSNRRHFFECAHREFAQARQQGEPLSFLMLDIDDFKDDQRHLRPPGRRQRVATDRRKRPRSVASWRPVRADWR